MENEKTIKMIAEEHWKWLEGLWNSFPDEAMFGLSTTEYLYKTAFVHGWKHAWKHAQHGCRDNSITNGTVEMSEEEMNKLLGQT
jgi:hypothetical protein